MGRRNYHPFTQEGVLGRMTDMIGVRYQCADLTRVFKVSSSEMHAVLDRLVQLKKIKSVAGGRGRQYWVETKEELALVENEVYRPPFRPLQGYEQSMRRFAEMAEKGR